MQKYIKILSQLGLPEHACTIYIALIQRGKWMISDITESTGLQRLQIYRNLPILIEKWLVFVTLKGKRKIYTPASPELLKWEYRELQKNTFQALDELWGYYQNTQHKTHITYGSGKKAIHNVYYDLLATLWRWWEFLRVTSEVDNARIKQIYQPKDYLEKRDNLWIERRIIMSESAYAQKKRKLEREEKVVASKDIQLDDDIMFTIYGDKLSLIDFTSETAITIESPQMARFQKKIFELLYKKV